MPFLILETLDQQTESGGGSGIVGSQGKMTAKHNEVNMGNLGNG
jgi:hypothetical protein